MSQSPNPNLESASPNTARPPLTPWRFVQRVTSGVLEHHCMGSSAQIAYYLMFATFPFLLSLASVLAFLPVPDLMDRMLRAIGAIAPAGALDLMRAPVERLVTHQHTDLFSAGVLLSVWAASNAVDATMHGLDRVQGLREPRSFWRMRGIAILLAVEVSFLMVLGLLGLWFGAQVSRWWEVRGGLGPLPVQVWDLTRWPLVLLCLIGAIDQLYFIGPAVRPRWRWITPGAVVAVLGWVSASLGFSSYVRHFGAYGAMYGSIGGVIILLTWMYLTAFFILLGAEINVVLEEGRAG